LLGYAAYYIVRLSYNSIIHKYLYSKRISSSNKYKPFMFINHNKTAAIVRDIIKII